MRVKGGMYCERCGKPIEAIRQGTPRTTRFPVSPDLSRVTGSG